MKLHEAISGAETEAKERGETLVPIRLATEPKFELHVIDGKFYFTAEDERGKRLNIEPVPLELSQIMSNDWEFEKRIWVGKKERKAEAGK